VTTAVPASKAGGMRARPVDDRVLATTAHDVEPVRDSSRVISASPIPVFSEKALMGLIGRLIYSYQQGDLRAFMGLFAENARTSDEPNPMRIRAEYRQLFDSTDSRELSISHLKWDNRRQHAVGKGDMNVRIRRNGMQERYRGGFSIEVGRRYRQLVILSLYYDLDRL